MLSLWFSMTSTALRAILAFGLTAFGGAAMALDYPRLASNESSDMRPHQARTQDGDVLRDMCREILVDTDEGYGVTNRESRLICDQTR
jgi:hypothetical protein